MVSTQSALRMLRGADPNRIATVRTSVDAGAAVRGQFRRNLELGCFQFGVACDIVAQRGLLSTTYLIKLEGEAGRMIPILEWMRDLDV